MKKWDQLGYWNWEGSLLGHPSPEGQGLWFSSLSPSRLTYHLRLLWDTKAESMSGQWSCYDAMTNTLFFCMSLPIQLCHHMSQQSKFFFLNLILERNEHCPLGITVPNYFAGKYLQCGKHNERFWKVGEDHRGRCRIIIWELSSSNSEQ